MFGLAMHGGWGTNPEVREYAASVFSGPGHVLQFFDILTENRWEYARHFAEGTPIPVQRHVTSISGPADFENLMRHAEHVGADADSILHFAFLRLCLEKNPNLRGVVDAQGNWWGMRDVPVSYMLRLVGTNRFATPFMLSRVYARGIPAEYAARVPFFEEEDYCRVYDAGVDPEYMRQFMLPQSYGLDLDNSAHHEFLAPIDIILQGWRDEIPPDYLKETVVP
jgi:hypothetical protein